MASIEHRPDDFRADHARADDSLEDHSRTARPEPLLDVRGGERVLELLARIGSRLGCSRVELYAVVDEQHAALASCWSPGARNDQRAGSTDPIDLQWFPWSLGNIKPNEYVFVRNAGTLPSRPGSDGIAPDLAMASALYLPIAAEGRLRGAIAAYWPTERTEWAASDRDTLREWANDALDSLETVR